MMFFLTLAWAGTAVSCPDGMALLSLNDDTFCIDRYEAHLLDWPHNEVPTEGLVAHSAPGVLPQAYISAELADEACENAGKRLCEPEEWSRACAGPERSAFPYGDVYQPGACNEGRATHPVLELFGRSADWLLKQMNDPRLNELAGTLAPSGSFAGCVTPEGVHDLHGNLHEWVADPQGTFRGGFYVDAKINGAGCRYRTTAHPTTYHDYSTGFRCCAEPDEDGWASL
jgi:formylglycine-generating enzyme